MPGLTSPSNDLTVAIAELSNLIGQLDGIAYNDFIDYAQTITMNNAPGSSSSGSSAFSNKMDLALDQLDLETVKKLILKVKEMSKASQPLPMESDDITANIAELSNLIGQLDGIAYNDFIDYAQTITMNNTSGSSSSDSSAYSNKFDLALDQLDMDTVKMLILKAKELPKAIQPLQDEDSPIPRKKAEVSNTHLETLLKVSNEKRQIVFTTMFLSTML